MNSDSHDSKNHVPPVYPGDDWGDLDREAEMPRVELPPRRLDRGIPTKRELNPVSAKKQVPHTKLSDDDRIPLTEPVAVVSETSAKTATKAVSKIAKKAVKSDPKIVTKQNTKKHAPDRSVKIMDEATEPISAANSSVANHESGAEQDTVKMEIPRPVTVAHGSKRFRVNEITLPRPADRRTQKTPPTISKVAGKRASNEEVLRNSLYHRGEAKIIGAKNVRGSLVWMICAGASVTLILVGAIILSRPSKKGSESGKLSAFSDITPDISRQNSKPSGGESLNNLINGEDQAKKIFATYAVSKSVDEFIGLIYLPEKNRGVISKVWEPMGVGSGWKPGENCTWTLSERGGVTYASLAGVLANFSGFNAVFRQDGDSIKMDWRATTGHCSSNYTELKKGQGDGAEIRAILSPGDFHTFTLPESDFRCFRLTSPDREENVWAYTKLKGANDVMLLSQFIPSQLTGDAVAEIPVVLVLERGPAQSLPNQWMISKVVRLDWLDE